MIYLCNNVDCVIKVIVASVTKTGHEIGYINSLLLLKQGVQTKLHLPDKIMAKLKIKPFSFNSSLRKKNLIRKTTLILKLTQAFKIWQLTIYYKGPKKMCEWFYITQQSYSSVIIPYIPTFGFNANVFILSKSRSTPLHTCEGYRITTTGIYRDMY